MSIIQMEHVWKNYPMIKDKPGFKELITHIPFYIKQKPEVFWALKDIDLTIQKGDCIGIIGKNGAGKSTLLSLLLGVAGPTKGRVKTSGKITPLLELGAGFHPDMTGRENIIMNGILLGLTRKEVSLKMDDIIRFSEIAEFIDMPVRIYSSGMYLRLAFSVAVHTEPEILLIDEILSVGDEFFQLKSENAIRDLLSKGVTAVFVSHSMASIEKICSRAIWLDHGEIKADGEAGKVVEQYLSK
jgi:lipopolysaccharide transport system ATP-binding protein